MDSYDEVLLKIILKEKIFLACLLFVMLVILFFVWKRCYKKIKKSKIADENTISKPKAILKSVIAPILVTCVFAFSFTAAAKSQLKNISKINSDIDNNSYETYTGDYYIYTSENLALNNCEFWLDNGLTVYKKDNGIFENLTTLNMEYQGTVIYGKNSLIIVDVANQKEK